MIYQLERRREAYRQFFREHPELLDADQREIVKGLKKAGVIAETTYWKDVNVKADIEIVKNERAPKTD